MPATTLVETMPDLADLPIERQMDLAQKGDKVAYDLVLRALSLHLHKFLGRKLPQKDRDDVIQEILLSVHKARGTYTSSRPLMPWVMAIARYRLNDYWRRIYGHVPQNPADINKMKDILSVDVTERLNANEDIRRIWLSLPDRQKTILDLMYRQDKSVQDVAQALGMSVSAVKVAAHRGYKVFRKRLQE